MIDQGPASIEFAGYDSQPVQLPQKGDNRLYSTKNAPPGLYFLASETVMPGSTAIPDGEIVTVSRSRLGTLYLSDPILRTWHGPGDLVKAPIQRNVVFKGGKSPLHVQLVDGLVIEDWAVEDDWDAFGLARAISVQSCRNVAVRDLRVGRAIETGAGRGYGLQVQRCTYLDLEDLTFTGCRHGVTPFACAKGTIRESRLVDCISEDGGHYAVEDVVWDSCDSGGKEMCVGNRFAWGCSVEIRNHRNARDLLLYGQTKTKIVGGQFAKLRCRANEAGSEMQVEVEGWPFTGIGFENGAKADVRIRS